MTKKEVILHLKQLASFIGKDRIIKQRDIRTVPKLDYYISLHFEKLGNALKAANLKPSELAEKMSVTNEELLEYLKELKSKGKKPTTMDIARDGKFSWKIFKTRFGSLKEAVEQLEQEQNVSTHKQDDEYKLNTKQAEGEPGEVFNKKRHYGRAAELDVTAELIYHGFQAGDIPIDEGLDILAVKDNKTYYFQVKHKDLGNNQSVKITKSSYEKTGGGDVYYIFVLLFGAQRKFLIVPYHRINDWKEDGWLSEEEMAYLLKIKEDNGRFKIINKDDNNELDITRFIDTWNQIR